MSASTYIACDLGAGSARVMTGTLEDDRLELKEVHRFTSEPVWIQDTLRWDVLGIFAELKKGLTKVARAGDQPAGLSVDSWGVDYVWLREDIPQLAPPFHYRDARTDATFETIRSALGRETIFAETGIQSMPINTLYQLASDRDRTPKLLDFAERFLMIGDYINYLFSGVPRAEESLASTSQLYNPLTRSWSKTLIEGLGLPERVFPELVPPGTVLGPLRPEISAETGLGKVPVIATCTHDTGSAVAAVPAGGSHDADHREADSKSDWAFLSSGTWSLIGVELPEPLLSEAALVRDFTNEVGLGGTSRFLKNTIGLWILAECRREWAADGKDFGFDELVTLARDENPLTSLIDPADERFWKPGDMLSKVRGYCKETAQPVPESPGQVAVCIFASLALLYKRLLDELTEVTGRQIETLHIVGGGSQNELLNQFAADATGCTVVAGPAEATAIGNVLIQALATGAIDSHAELRRIVRNSFPVHTFEARDPSTWRNAAGRLAALIPNPDKI